MDSVIINWDGIARILGEAYWCRFRKCQAWFTPYCGWLWIKSYNTLVAVITDNGTIIVRDYYSRTTSKHISQIYKMWRAQHGQSDS